MPRGKETRNKTRVPGFNPRLNEFVESDVKPIDSEQILTALTLAGDGQSLVSTLTLQSPMMNARLLLTLLLFTLGICRSPAAATQTQAKPNIIFILADDLGFAEISANKADNYKTPNIDALANEGMRFNHFYTAPLCGPSRAMILTGRYGFRSGAVTQSACGSMVRTGPKAEVMVHTVLKKAGYTTAMIGKWGQILPSGNAAEWGFDHMMSFKASGIYWNKTAAAAWVKKYGLAGDKDGEDGVRANPGPYNINEKQLMLADNEYMPDLLQTNAIDFINDHKDKPFFLYYSLSHVHAQHLPTPDSAPPDMSTDAAERYNQIYTDNIHYMDKLVGKLVAEVDRLKIRENTVIMFMGDNGTGKHNADRATIGGRRLSGQKGSMEEGGGLVPFVVNWRGVTTAGRVNDNISDASDLLPTFAEIAGASVPEDRVIDGISLVPQLKGETSSRRTWAFTQLGENWHVREAAWKLNQSGQLFDMKNAPFEEIPVPSDSRDESAVAAHKRLGEVLAQLNPAGGFKAEGDGRGDKKQKKKTKDAEPGEKPKPAEATPPAQPNEELAERAEKFDKIDKEKAGKLTRESFIATQSDAESAAERFDKYDADKDGFLSREEYITRGGKYPKGR